MAERSIISLYIYIPLQKCNERGEKQLLDYLEYYQKDKGYMLSFNFNKNKKTGVREINMGSRTIVEAVV